MNIKSINWSLFISFCALGVSILSAVFTYDANQHTKEVYIADSKKHFNELKSEVQKLRIETEVSALNNITKNMSIQGELVNNTQLSHEMAKFLFDHLNDETETLKENHQEIHSLEATIDSLQYPTGIEELESIQSKLYQLKANTDFVTGNMDKMVPYAVNTQVNQP